jgi:hypothetical protein
LFVNVLNNLWHGIADSLVFPQSYLVFWLPWFFSLKSSAMSGILALAY